MKTVLINDLPTPRSALVAAGVPDAILDRVEVVWTTPTNQRNVPISMRQRTGIEIRSHVGSSREYARVAVTRSGYTSDNDTLDLEKVAKRVTEVIERAALRRLRVVASQNAAARAREARRAEDAAAEKAAAALVNLKATASRFSGGRIIVNATLTIDEARALDVLLGELRGVTAATK